jgi:hypothetical protein
MEEKKDPLKILEENKDKLADYEKLKRHLGKKIPHEFGEEGNKDIFEFRPISYDLYVRFMSLTDALSAFDEKAVKSLMEVMVELVLESYPGWPKEVAEQFVATNFEEIMNLLEKLMPKGKGDVRDLKKIQQQLKFIKESKQNVPGTSEPEKQDTEQAKEANS